MRLHGKQRSPRDAMEQVNGKELSKSSHDETVEAFRAARDPVVVQVIRRTPSGRPHGPPQEIHVVDVCTQTDITFEHIMALAKLQPSTPPVPDVCPFLLSDRSYHLRSTYFNEWKIDFDVICQK
ncbi:PDZ domain-containing RING finger protein 4 [Ataeniobius toweri]|uniref:PDZ domain-containing RING finger protein 4 n=1 Tax=Ataeniobius toweri TaxID=208326 RepID=A0ABU7AQD9_9TELE|nr:PDZ domain-containing RING finger protein 4 [Ataeniobius toweri]